jgi:hypothetical protein
VRWSLHDWPKTGLVGPVSNCAPEPQRVAIDYAELSGLDDFAARRRRDHAGKAVTAGRLTGFCLLTRRDVLDKLGGLDERYSVGFFEDDDLCARARRAGGTAGRPGAGSRPQGGAAQPHRAARPRQRAGRGSVSGGAHGIRPKWEADMGTALDLRILKGVLSALVVCAGGAICLPADEIVARGLDCVFCPRVDGDGHTVVLKVRGTGPAAAAPRPRTLAAGGRRRPAGRGQRRAWPKK